jgi:opacity protein-like surface antigen
MRRILWLFLLGFSTLFLAHSTHSQDFSRKFTLGLRGGFWKMGFTEHSDSNMVGNLGTLFLRYDWKEKVSLGFLVTYAKTWEADLSGKLGGGAGLSFSKREEARSSNQIWLDLLFLYRFRPWERFSPYLLGGGGIAFWSAKDEDGNPVQVMDRSEEPFDLEDQELTISLGGGLEYRFRERWGLDFGTRFRILTHILTGLKDSKDIVGTRPGELDLPKATLEFFLGINYYFGKLSDSDKDGVPDRTDFCADTPYGAMVDEKGCPLDSDGDGIYDGLDKCPRTSPGEEVDVNGCPRK